MSKSGRDLIEEYEPVLRFACGERFFPMAVEDYVAKCDLLEHRSRRPDRLAKEWKAKPPPEKLAALADLSSQHYLRIERSYPLALPITYAVIFTLVLAAALIFGSATTVRYVVLFGVLIGALGWAVNSRHRIFVLLLAPAAYWAAIYFWRLGADFVGPWASAGLIALQLGLIVSPFIGWRIFGVFLFLGGAGCGYAAWAIYGGYGLWPALWVIPAQLVGSLFLAVMARLVIRFAPGFLFSVFSKATSDAAESADKLFGDGRPPTYYARVVRKGGWTVLQYFYFYAFNDYRRTAEGLNQHEADWEMVAVFLEGEAPRGLAFSAHHQGTYCDWSTQVRKATQGGRETNHPIIYVALGSHANYPAPSARDVALDEVLHGARFERFQNLVARLLVALIELDEHIRANLRKTMERPDPRGRRYEYQPFVPRDYATGDGVRIGFAVSEDDLAREAVLQRADYINNDELPDTCAPERLAWKTNEPLSDPLPPWVEYKGLWGIRSALVNESGPPGPKWDRVPKGAAQPEERIRWKDPLAWKHSLEGDH
ncbi:MAG: hypothetical protein ACE5FI_15465 [Anaerolineales bacterium]